jgi:AAA family ATP:ADP antiporter
MLARLSKLVPVKPGERLITALMFSYIFGVLFFYYILDPLRKGLFLKSFPSSQLPYAYFLTAVFAGAIASVVFKLSKTHSAIALVTAINLAIIATLLYFRWAMGRDLWYLPWIYFVYVKIVSVLSTAQFWLLAGYIYDQRQAKRIYGFLGAGAILGATAGSFVPAFLSQRLGTASMLMVCVGVCVVLILLSHAAWRYRKPEAEAKPKTSSAAEPKARFSELWQMIFGSRHLALMVLLIFVVLIATQIADWQIDDAAQRAFQGQPQERFSEFYGRFSLTTNILAIAVQLFATNFVVNRVGILGAIVFLPAGLFLTSIGVLLYPTLLTAALVRGSDTVARYSINRAGIEMLYLPLPPAVRKRLKIFVDVFVDRTGRAFAGVVILLLTTSYLPFRQRGTAAVAIVLSFAAVLACIQLRKSYIDAFRGQLTRREMELGDVSHYVTDKAAVQLLVNTLDHANERQMLYSFRLLQSVRNVDFSAQLFPLLRHHSSHVREEAIRTLQALPRDCTAEAEEALQDTSEAVRLAAVEYLCAMSNGSAPGLARLQSLLHHPKIEVRLAAARWAASPENAPGFEPAMELIEGLLAHAAVLEESQAVAARAAAAALAARLPDKDGLEVLRRLIDDPSPRVAAAAAIAAGQSGQLKLVFNVVNMLTSRDLRNAGREALLSYGERIGGTLGDLLGDKKLDIALRREIPWVLGRVASKRSVEFLIENFESEDALLKFRIAKGLNRLHESNPDLPLPRAPIADRVHQEMRGYYELLSIRKSIEAAGNGGGLLLRAVHERLEQKLEIVFRLLGLLYPQKDIYSAFLAWRGARADRRTAAIEFLDNLLEKPLKGLILPLLEETSVEAQLAAAGTSLGIKVSDRDHALRRLLAMPDVWLRACALYEIGEKRIRALAGDCRALAGTAEPLVNETAGWALAQLR